MSDDKPPTNLVSIESGQTNLKIRDELRDTFKKLSEMIEPGIKGYALVIVRSNDEVIMCDQYYGCYFALLGGVEAVKHEILQGMRGGEDED